MRPADALDALIEAAAGHLAAGEPADAERIYGRVLQAWPNHPVAAYNLALLLIAGGRAARARQLLTNLVKAQPGLGPAHYTLGKLFQRDGAMVKSLYHLRRAAELEPDRVDARIELISALAAAGRLDEAAAAADQAAARLPDRPEIPTQLGVALAAAGQADRARAAFRTALAIAPDFLSALYNDAKMAEEQGDLAAALDGYRRVVAIDPGFETGLVNLGNAELQAGDVEAAIATLDRALARNPADSIALSNRLMAAQYQPGVTAAELRTLHEPWQARIGAATAVPARPWPAPGRRLRIGLVSSDLRQHPVGYFTIGAVERLDPERFEVVAYAAHDCDDAIARRFKRALKAWTVIGQLGDDAAAAVIARDRPDVLIDLAGHTRGARLELFARRLAPVQATWAGYVGTTGVAAMDALIADRFHVPPGEDGAYVEQVVRLPDGYVAFDPPADAPDVAPLPAGDAGPVTFGSFSNPAKINPDVVRLWARLLAAEPAARLRLAYGGYQVPAVQARIAGWFAEAGIDPARIGFEGARPRQALLAAYGDIDIALDPFPYSGGLTTLEALWMGVPVVTLPGRTFAGRHASSHLSVAGLGDLVAADADGYVAIALGLAGDRRRLAALRAGLRAQVAASPLCDAARFAGNLGAALQALRQSRTG